MKILIACLMTLLSVGLAWCEDAMTAEQFKKIAATPGDAVALRPELAVLPFWSKSKCSVTMKYEAGKVFKEDCAQTTKTVGGKYIVFTVESKFYKQPMVSIVGYDDAASSIRTWGLFGDTLTQSTMVYDPEKKISASTATYPPGFMEVSVGAYTAHEVSERTQVYQEGKLFMTREIKIVPEGKAGIK